MTGSVSAQQEISSLTNEQLWQELLGWWHQVQCLHLLSRWAFDGEVDYPLLAPIGDGLDDLADEAMERHVAVAAELGKRDLAPAGQDVSFAEVEERWPDWAWFYSHLVATPYFDDEDPDIDRTLREFLLETGLGRLLGIDLRPTGGPDSEDGGHLTLVPLSAATRGETPLRGRS